MAKTINYDWDLPSPGGLQLGEIAKIATTFTVIDVKMKSFETALSTHKHAFAELTNKPTTLGGYGITDGMTSDEIATAIKSAVDNLVNGSGEALDTLKELADALGNDPNFAASVGTALGVRVRVDAATNFSLAQRAQGRANIDALGTVDKGAAGGVASLDAGGKVPSAQLPALTTTATVGAAVAGANGKTTPADGDFFAGVEAGGSTMFKATWGNIKAALQSFFDSRYLRLAGGVLTAQLRVRATPASYAYHVAKEDNTGNLGGIYRSAEGLEVYFRNNDETLVSFLRSTGISVLTSAFTVSGGDIKASSGSVYASGNVYAGGGTGILNADGNTQGSRWMSFGGSVYAADAIENRIQAVAGTKAGVYTGDGTNETNFPIGHLVAYQGGNRNVNSAVTIRLGNNTNGFDSYQSSGSNTALAGVWRSRGVSGQQGSTGWWGGIAQRTE